MTTSQNIPIEDLQSNHEPAMQLSRAWYTIWYRPRGTIRQIIDTNPGYQVVLLAALSGVARLLDQAAERSLGDQLSVGWIMALAVVVGSGAGILSLYISGALFQWTGSWFGGQANAIETRAAVAWSSVPDLLMLPLFGLIILLSGNEWFTSAAGESNPILFLGLLALAVPAGIFILGMRFFLLVKCLAEAHRFSAWKGLFSLLAGVVVVAIPVILFSIWSLVTR